MRRRAAACAMATPIGAFGRRARGACSVLRSARSSLSRPSPRSRCSPSPMRACSTKCRRAPTTSARRWNNRPRPPTFSRRSAVPRLILTPCWTTLIETAGNVCAALTYGGDIPAGTAMCIASLPRRIRYARRPRLPSNTSPGRAGSVPVVQNPDRPRRAGRSRGADRLTGRKLTGLRPKNKERAARIGNSRASWLCVCRCCRDGEPLGAFASGARRADSVYVSARSTWVATFADQAVIAIENVRLFDEVQARTRDLEESLAAADRHRRCAQGHQPLELRSPNGVARR